MDTRLQTLFSNNIRNNFGFLNRADERGIGQTDKLFIQEGRKVFKEVCPAVAEQITAQLAAMDISPDDLKRIWLHQANQNMNDLIARKVFGRDPSALESPTILDEYANTSSAGSSLLSTNIARILYQEISRCCVLLARDTALGLSCFAAAERIQQAQA